MRDRRGTTPWSKSLSGIGRTEVALLATLLLGAAIFGGSSRYDVMQNALMQPLAWLVAGLALATAGFASLRPVRVPLLFLAALVVLTLVQLVPLPYGTWTSLPGREPLADIAVVIGSDSARPLALVPARAANALASLGIPLAALFLFAAMGRRAVMPLLSAIVLLATANALLALVQIATGFAEAAYPYSITNLGEPVGIFANRNHSAVFSALALLVIAFLATRERRKQFAGVDILLWSIYSVIFLTVLANGSRAGLLCAGIAMVATAMLVFRQGSEIGGKRDHQALLRLLPAAVIGLFAVGLVVLFLLADRLAAFQRIVAANPLEDLRFRILPVLGEMFDGYWPFGIGIGSFEDAFRIHETDDLLRPAYLNMAHNDWLQWPIETGLPGVLLLLALLAWLGLQLKRLKDVGRGTLVLGVAGLAIIAIASYFDYPLRTPIFQIAAVWFVCALACLARPPLRQNGENADIAMDNV